MRTILALNWGSSSLRYTAFAARDGAEIAEEDELLGADLAAGSTNFDVVRADLEAHEIRPQAIGHRVVFGGEHQAPERVTDELLQALDRIAPLSHLHLDVEIATIRGALQAFPGVPQVACFDTAFHAAMPAVAHWIPISRALRAQGVRRYGFHGLSYEYIVQRLGARAQGNVVIAHLGNGASMAAVRDGAPVDTTMGFTPLAGLMMGTRPGDLDPGVLTYLMRSGYDADRLGTLLERESGLRGVSETSADVRELLAARATDRRAAEALELFVYLARKQLATMVSALGGLDRLVFTGGIGEHAAPVRDEIVAGLDYLRPFEVLIVPTDENLMVARHTRAVVDAA